MTVAMVAGVLLIGVALAFVTGVFGGSSSKANNAAATHPIAAISLAGLSGTEIVARAQAAARLAGAVHLDLDTHAGNREMRFSDDDFATGGVQHITAGAAVAEVRVIGRATYFTGNRAAITGYFGMPTSTVPPTGVWFRLVPGDTQYQTVTDGVTFASAMHEMSLAAPYTVLPLSQRHGVSVIGIRGRVGAAPAGTPATATLWVAASGSPLPIEYDASGGNVSLTATFSNWGHTSAIAQPMQVRPAPKEPYASGRVADIDMKIILRNLATLEEVYLTDNGSSYGTATALRTENLSAIKLGPGQTITIHLAGQRGYCLTGKVGSHYFIYSSLAGGLSGPFPSDACSESMYPTNGGQLPLG